MRVRSLGLALTAAAALAPAAHAQRSVFVVSPSGDDSGPGTADQPWRTISHAARSVPAGALVDIRGGTYPERVVVRVSGAPGSPTTFAAHDGERVTISGKGLRPRGEGGLIHVQGRSNLEFSGLELRRFATRRRDVTPAGVWITGASSDIALRALDVHRIRAARKGNAHGIAVKGTSGSAPITGISIEGNNVHDLKLGSSEAIVVNGNVDGWTIRGNTVDDVDNIGIDAIGFEHTAPRNDRARNGLIADNRVSDVDTRGNAAYLEDGVQCRCAGGIYVDGGHNIVIERNRVTRANLGIELASEHPGRLTSDVLVRNNLVSSSDNGGLIVGGFNAQVGKARHVEIVNNTFLDNDRMSEGVGEVVINYGMLDSAVLNNVFVSDARGIMVTNFFRLNRGNRIDGNIWFAPGRDAGRATWYWKKRRLRGFDAWRSGTGGDAGGQYADPLLTVDGLPGPGSPVIDRGVPTDLAGETDLAGAARVQGAALDAGAFESSP